MSIEWGLLIFLCALLFVNVFALKSGFIKLFLICFNYYVILVLAKNISGNFGFLFGLSICSLLVLITFLVKKIAQYIASTKYYYEYTFYIVFESGTKAQLIVESPSKLRITMIAKILKMHPKLQEEKYSIIDIKVNKSKKRSNKNES